MDIRKLFKPISLLLVGGVTLISSALVNAALTPAGFVIGNQAAAQYTVGGQVFTVTSNLVETIVANKAAVALASSQTLYGAPGGNVYFTHQITNNGNFTDTFNLTTGSITGGLTNVQIFADANSDGIPDNATAITVTPAIAQGGTFNVVISASIPSSAAAASTGSFVFTATSATDATVSATNTDTVNVTNSAIMTLSKSMTPSNPAPGSQVTITLSYGNMGAINSGTVTITDLLPTNMTYVAGSGLWNNVALTDAAGGDPTGIAYDWNVTTAGTMTAVLTPGVISGANGTIVFKATVSAAAPAGIITNYGNVTYFTDNTNTTSIGPLASNASTIVVNGVPAVTVTDTGSTTDSDGSNGKVTPAGPIYAGSALMFDNVIINAGNMTDTYNITYTNTSFPAGSTYTFYKSDGLTPLTDTNNDGTIDTGPIAAGATTHIFVRVQLPPNASGTGPFYATLTATSVTSSAVTGSVANNITSITGASVDLTNTITGTNGGTAVADGGWGPGPESVPQVTVTTNPGTTATFNLYINHSASAATTYQIDYSTVSNFATLGGLPAGWSVVFNDASGNLISELNLNAAASGGTIQSAFTAVVTVPAGATTGNQPIYFRVRSTGLNISDIIYDQITVNTLHDMALLTNGVGQVIPGEAVVYKHLLINHGNATETSGTISVITSATGWVATAYLDVDGNGVFTPGTDVVFTNLSQISGGLASGASKIVFVRVQAPNNAVIGDTNVSTMTVTVTGDGVASNNTVMDQTTVTSGSVQLLKEQAPNASCNGTADSGFVTTNITSVKPGGCVLYRVTVTNISAIPVTTVAINDNTPQNTVLQIAAAVGGTASPAGSVSSTPTVGNSGKIVGTWTNLSPTQTAILTYGVKIQ